jgi:hypothetical protein
MLWIYFTRQRFVSIEKLLKREPFNSAFFILIILPSIIENVSVLRSKIQVQDYWLHIDNVKFHAVALSLQKTEEADFTRLPRCHIFMIWHPETSSHSDTWRKNENGRISDEKTRQFLQWEQYWKRFWFECFPRLLNNGLRDCMGVL